MNTFDPPTVPAFAAIRARKRARDRRRIAAGGALLSVLTLVSAAVVVPSLRGDTDRLTGPGGFADRRSTSPALRSTPAASRTTFQVLITGPRSGDPRRTVGDTELRRCLELPGASGDIAPQLSDPPSWQITVEGTADQAAAVHDCLAALKGAAVSEVAGSNPPTRRLTTFYVRYRSPASYNRADDGRIQRCLSLPGAAGAGSRTSDSAPPTYKIGVIGSKQSVAVKTCLQALPNLAVTETPNGPKS